MFGLYRRSILEITVFVCGALVMIFEIIGSRILSPFIGTSTYVWTSLIGVILASLSLGYWFGGKFADKRPDIKILAAVIFSAGALVSVTVLIKEVLLSMIAGAAVGLEIKALIAAILLFAPASVCMGFVTPFAVRLKLTSIESTGQTVGRLYALSTVGSIVGTFAAGFYLIPFVGSVRTLYIIAGSLLMLSVAIAPFAISKTNIAGILLFILGVGGTETNIWLLHDRAGVLDLDTEYSRVQVFSTSDPATGKEIKAIATDPYFVQSAAFLESDDLVFDYARYYHLIRYFNPGFSNTLIIGGAGYSFPKEYLRVYPDARIDVVEIDPQMTKIARDHFRLIDDPRMNIIHEDGRMYVNRAAGGQYDAVLMDAFGSLFSVPYHLTTHEAVVNLHRTLNGNGVVVFNLGASITGPGNLFLNAELATYRDVFPSVYLFKVNGEYADDRLQNLIIVASKKTNLTNYPDPEIARLFNHLSPASSQPVGLILTDDLAPVEYYNSVAQNLFIMNR
ncbi:fused MFS/spermidine synthase [soil metagenome]